MAIHIPQIKVITVSNSDTLETRVNNWLDAYYKTGGTITKISFTHTTTHNSVSYTAYIEY